MSNCKKESSSCKKTSIGGQALIEGLLMMGPEKISIVVRAPGGELVEKTSPRKAASKISKIPVIRGAYNMFSQMKTGVSALMYSTEFVDLEDEPQKTAVKPDEESDITPTEQPDTNAAEMTYDEDKKDEEEKKDEEDKKKSDGTIPEWLLILTVIFSLSLSVGLFILLPNLLVSFLPIPRDVTWGNILSNIVEGITRILIFLGYLSLTSMIKEMKRVWMYHGAEHKTIYCYESGKPLTVENVRSFPKEHRRCGTSFLFLVMVVSIIVFSLVGQYGRILNLVIRLLLIPLVAGISYELIKFAGRHDNLLSKILSSPGLLFQKFTTKEPDDDMIEVAIKAMQNVIPENTDGDNW